MLTGICVSHTITEAQELDHNLEPWPVVLHCQKVGSGIKRHLVGHFSGNLVKNDGLVGARSADMVLTFYVLINLTCWVLK